MLHLWLIIAGVWIVAAMVGLLFARFMRNAPRGVRSAFLALSIGWIVINGLLVYDNPTITRWIPWKNMLALGSLQPFAVAMLLGVAWHELPKNVLRRTFVVLLGAGVCFWQSYGYLLKPTPQTRARWAGVVCKQTTQATCSAAAAATLLKIHGIDTSEAEMARLCLTTAAGTTKFGLYRGLAMKTEGAGYRVRPLPPTIEELPKHCPALITVRLDAGQDVDPRYSRDWGWAPGVSHTVVLLRFESNGKVEIADPSVGQEQWDMQGIRDLWKGKGFYLEARD